jgi:hypothetical protein
MASPSTTEPRILPVYPSKPAGDDLEAFKAAKASMGIDYLIQPVRAVCGSPFRVIALRERPDFVCDYAFVKNPTEASIRSAMDWALSDKVDSRATTVLDVLKQIFGEDTRELGRSS